VSRAARWLLAAGILLFVAVLVSHDLKAILAVLALAGWGLIGVALFHLVPLALDAAAIRVLEVDAPRGALRATVLVRWIGESANSLMPAGQIGGPLLMIRQLIQGGAPAPQAVAAVTVSTTLQSFAQIVFALMGLALLGGRAGMLPAAESWSILLAAAACLGLMPGAFYLLQRRGLFVQVSRLAVRFAPKRDWSHLQRQAADLDGALKDAYQRRGAVWSSFILCLLGWVVGTGEVWLILHLLHSPVSWSNAMMLESLGQAIRGAGFAIPGSLGVQEGGYLLLAPLAGLRPDVALALSLAKRARELLLGIPGLIYLHFSERAFRRRAALMRAGDAG
jgi:putative membrane protein